MNPSDQSSPTAPNEQPNLPNADQHNNLSSAPQPQVTPQPVPAPVAEPTPAEPAAALNPEPVTNSVTAAPVTTPVPLSAPAPVPVPSPQVIQPAGVNQPSDTASQPQAMAQPVVVSMAPGGFKAASSAMKRPTALFLALIALVIILLGGGAAAYFAVILPNQPENLWATALNHTSKGYDELVKSSQKNNDKGFKADGNFKVTAASMVVDGTFTSKSDGKNSNTSLDVGAAGQRLNLVVQTNTTPASTSPDIYLKASGLTGVGNLISAGEPSLSNALKGYDNQWYFIDHTLLEQATQSATQSSSATQPSFTKQDKLQIEQKFGDVNKQYIFTTNKDKAVLTVVSKFGKEKLDSRNTYHYKIGYDKSHLKAYVTALKDSAKQTKINDYFKTKSLEDTINFNKMLQDIDSAKGTGTADVWVDTAIKTIHKVRFSAGANAAEYLDITMDYTGGDNVPLAFDMHTSTITTASLKLNLNTKTDVTTMDISFNSTSGNGNVHITAQPSNDDVPFTKPANAKSFGDLIGGFQSQLGGLSGASAGTKTTANPASSLKFN